jgi:hypothetical protein
VDGDSFIIIALGFGVRVTEPTPIGPTPPSFSGPDFNWYTF